jgi:hypothetical protein
MCGIGSNILGSLEQMFGGLCGSPEIKITSPGFDRLFESEESSASRLLSSAVVSDATADVGAISVLTSGKSVQSLVDEVVDHFASCSLHSPSGESKAFPVIALFGPEKCGKRHVVAELASQLATNKLPKIGQVCA